MNTARIHLLLALALLAAVTAGGCGNHFTNTLQPSVPAGHIEGFVRMAVTPVNAAVRARLVGDSPQIAAQFDTPVSRDGFYSMDLPAGRYILGVMLRNNYSVDYEYRALGLTAGDIPPDTLRIDARHSPVTVNLDLASLRVHLDVSPELDGSTAHLLLHPVGAAPGPGWRSWLFARPMQIHGGAVDELLTAVVPGTYKLELVLTESPYLCNCQYDGEHFWMPGVHDAGQSPPLEIPANHLVAIEGGLDLTAASLEGRISGAWQQLGLGPPSVSLFALDSTVVRSALPVGQDGTFEARLYVPGPVKLLVTHDTVRQWIGGANFAAATVFVLDPGQTVAGIQFVESGAQVEMSASTTPSTNMTLQFFDAATLALAAEWSSPGYSTPPLRVPNLRPGTYRLRVDLQSRGGSQWISQWYDRVENPQDARVITIGGGGDIVHIPLVLQMGAVISGTVRAASGQLSRARLFLTNENSKILWGSSFYYPPYDRGFVISGVPNGRWKIGASSTSSGAASAGVPELPPDIAWYPATTNWQFARAITIRDLKDVAGVDIVLPPPVP